MAYISIIIPSYNSSEALLKNLPYLKEFLNKEKLEAEVIIVDDGSVDDGATKKVVETIGFNYVGYKMNKGKGHAVREGIKEASGDYILYTDADIPFEGDAIHTILHYLKVKEFDLAIGDRSLDSSEYFSKVSTKRKFGSGVFTFIVGRFITTGITDTQCGLKGFRREVAKDLFGVSLINSFTFDVELIYIALKRNYDIKKVPVTLRSQDGNSVNVFKHAMGMAIDLLKIKLNHVRGLYKKR